LTTGNSKRNCPQKQANDPYPGLGHRVPSEEASSSFNNENCMLRNHR
jgi:hypothetical protein